jgi:hypothetical protein
LSEKARRKNRRAFAHFGDLPLPICARLDPIGRSLKDGSKAGQIPSVGWAIKLPLHKESCALGRGAKCQAQQFSGFTPFAQILFGIAQQRNFRPPIGVATFGLAQKREATLILSRPINVLAAFAAFAFVGAVLLGMF